MTQKNAYAKLMKSYDNVLTARRWWSRLYMRYVWKLDDNAIAREVLQMLPDDFRGTILDVPVGTAVFTYDKYRRMKEAEIVGLDYSPEMLQLAQARLDAEQIRNVNLLQGDVGALPFPDEYFDCVLSMNGFHTFPDKEQAFAETFRVLKPGGTFCGCFYVTGQRRFPDWIVRTILNKKGLFLPPHYTLKGAKTKLHSLFGGGVVMRNERSILIFACTKPQQGDSSPCCGSAPLSFLAAMG